MTQPKGPTSRHHIMVYDEDWEFLNKLYGKGSDGAALGVSGAIRETIHQKCQSLRLKMSRALDGLTPGDQGNQRE